MFGEWIADLTDRLTVVLSFRSDWWKNFDARIASSTGTAVSQAFRAPTSNELYRGFGVGGFAFLSNENLAPNDSPAAKSTWKTSAGPLIHSRSWRISGHADEVKDQMLFVTQSSLAAQRRTVGRTRTYGGGFDVLFQPRDGDSLDLSCAPADSAIRDPSGNSSRMGKRVPNMPRHQVVMGLTVGHPDRIRRRC